MKIENQIGDISESYMIPCTEEELAQYLKNSGNQVVQHHGCFWKETFFGFYEPLHWMDCLSAEQATCPPKVHWGFRCALRDKDIKTNIGSLLTFDFVQACRRSGKIKQVVNGLHRTEDPSLSTFKKSMQFSLQHIPIKIQINPIVAKFMQWRYPDKYYRLTGYE